MSTATFRIWRGDAAGGAFRDYSTEVAAGMVVLDAVHQIQAEQANDLAVRWNCKAGKCGSCSAEINGNAAADVHDAAQHSPLDQPVTIEPMKAFPLIKDLVTDVSWNYRGEAEIKPVQAAAARCRRTDLAHGAGGRRSRSGIPQVHRMFSVPGRLPRAARAYMHEQFIGPRFLVYTAALEMHPLDAEDRTRRPSKTITASASATSRSAARRFARKASRSPIMPSSR